VQRESELASEAAIETARQKVKPDSTKAFKQSKSER